MNTLRQAFMNQLSTPTTYLRGLGRIDCDNFNTSFLRFVLKKLRKQTQTRIIRRSRYVFIAIHKCQCHIFNGDKVIFRDQMSCDFVKVISPLICDLFMQMSDSIITLLPAMAIFLLTCSMTLQSAQKGKVKCKPTWIFNNFAVGASQKCSQPNINPNSFSGELMCQTGIRQLKYQENIPSTIVLFHHNMLQCSIFRYRTMETNFYFTHILNIKLFQSTFILPKLASIAICVLNGLKPVPSFESWKARRFTHFYSSIEAFECLIKTTKHMLHARSVQFPNCVSVFVSLVPKVYPLRVVINPFSCGLVDINSLFQSSIIDHPGLPKEKIQASGLFISWAQKVLVCSEHSLTIFICLNIDYGTNVLQISDEVNRFFLAVFLIFVPSFALYSSLLVMRTVLPNLVFFRRPGSLFQRWRFLCIRSLTSCGVRRWAWSS